MPTKQDLIAMQALPLEIKIMKTLARVREWVQYWGEDNVYISFSGGKDSTVLLHLVRSVYPNIRAVFIDTGLEYPEIKAFVRTFDNVEIIKPKLSFKRVLEEFGYPLISKEISSIIDGARNSIEKGVQSCRLAKLGIGSNKFEKSQYNAYIYAPLLDLPFKVSDKCCRELKKKPAKQAGDNPIIATLACESKLRESQWLKSGCNSFGSCKTSSTPLSFWTEQDILHYIDKNNIQIASVYGDIVPDSFENGQIAIDNDFVKLKCSGCQRTGCMFCLFGMHLEKGENRIQILHKTHPKIYDYVLGGGEFGKNGLWRPSNSGLGFKFVMDEVNRVMGKNIYKY